MSRHKIISGDGNRRAYSAQAVGFVSVQQDNIKHTLKHFTPAGGWKKFETLWNFIIKTEGLNKMLPLLEAILSKVPQNKNTSDKTFSPFPAIA